MRLNNLARRAGFAVGGALALALVTAPAAVAQDTATVYVVHGIPKTPVDVYVDGKRALDDFQPGTSQGPVDLPAGPHKVAIFPADAADGSGSPLLSADADLPEGANVTLVAHLDADGKPTVTPFKNDVAKVAAGQARLVVRHTAAAPAVDVLAGGKPVIQGLTNPNEKELDGARGLRVGRGGRGGQHRPGDRPGRRGPQGGHGDLRARHRLAAGQEPRPGELHGLEPAQLAVRRAVGAPSGAPYGRPARVGAGPRSPAWPSPRCRGPAARGGACADPACCTPGGRAASGPVRRARRAGAGLRARGRAAGGGRPAPAPRCRPPRRRRRRRCPPVTGRASRIAEAARRDGAARARSGCPRWGSTPRSSRSAWTSAARWRCPTTSATAAGTASARPRLGRRVGVVSGHVDDRDAGPRRVLPPGRPGGGRPRRGRPRTGSSWPSG